MLLNSYQRVGVLAGVLLFVGSWLSAYYNNWLWPLVATICAVVAGWLALENMIEEETTTRVVRGFVTGLIAGVVARVLGLLTMTWAFDNWTSSTTASYTVLSDFYSVVINGELWTSVLAVLGVGIVGGFLGYVMPYFSAEREEA